jgi:hypothetical protein
VSLFFDPFRDHPFILSGFYLTVDVSSMILSSLQARPHLD